MDFSPFLAEIERAKSFSTSLIAFLNGLPPATTVAQALADLKAANDSDVAALDAAGAANVTPPTP